MVALPVTKRQWRDARDFAIVTIALVLVVLAVIFAAGGHRAIDAYFAWPSGGVWSNLVAGALVAPGSVFVLVRRAEARHAEHLKLVRAQHDAQLAQADEHHAEALLHMTTQVRQAVGGEIAGICQGMTKRHRQCRNPVLFGTTRCRAHRIH
jgi:hypothetical protein